MPVDRSVWVVVRRGLREDVNTYKKTLKQKDKELSLERRLWSSREAGWDSET